MAVTSSSISLLDRIPLKVLNADYGGTVNEIISRESLEDEQSWQEQPQTSIPGVEKRRIKALGIVRNKLCHTVVLAIFTPTLQKTG